MFKDPFEIDFTSFSWFKERKSFYNKNEKYLYRKLTEHALSGKPFPINKKYTEETVNRIMKDVYYTNPLMFGVEKVTLVKDGTHSKNRVTFSYIPDYEELKNKVKDKVKELYESMKIEKCKTDLEIELAVNDWLCSNCKYCMDMDFRTKHSVIGILLKGRGVCSSFALCTSLLLMCFGVECYPVLGDMKDPHYKEQYEGIKSSEFFEEMFEVVQFNDKQQNVISVDNVSTTKFEKYKYEKEPGHAWNYVYIEEKGRHLDVTFNNGHNKGSSGKNKHSFFNLTDSEIKKDRYLTFGPKYNKKR